MPLFKKNHSPWDLEIDALRKFTSGREPDGIEMQIDNLRQGAW